MRAAGIDSAQVSSQVPDSSPSMAVSGEPMAADDDADRERRGSPDRRRRFWWSLLYGSFNPRRRQPRREYAQGVHVLDWHHSRLLAVVLAILALCVTDAFLTLILLQAGAHEANPVMASVVYGDPGTFTSLKMVMTGCSVAVMVMLAGYRFLGVFRVELLLYVVLSGYLGLVGYELWMLGELGNIPLHL